MFSGKTTYLLHELTMLSDIGMKCLYINHSLDNRENKDVSTHKTSKTNKLNIDTIRADKLINVDVSSYNVIGIDEGQFFSDIHTVKSWIKGRIIYISSLDGDYLREPFMNVLSLIPECDTVIKLNAYCHSCLRQGKYTKSAFSKRLIDSNERIVIGGKDKYISVCRECL